MKIPETFEYWFVAINICDDEDIANLTKIVDMQIKLVYRILLRYSTPCDNTCTVFRFMVTYLRSSVSNGRP